MKLTLLICATTSFLFLSSFIFEKEVRYCNRTFLERTVKVFLKDEGIASRMVEVKDKKTKKIAFGYFLHAIRNDTNFIYSHISRAGDTIISKTFHDYKISKGKDSVITKFLCTRESFRLYSVKRFWNGKITYDTVFNTRIIRY